MDPAANLRIAGQHLEHIGTLPDEDFDVWLRGHYYRYLIGHLTRAESCCREAQTAGIEPWREQCSNHASELNDALSCVGDISAWDLRGGATPAESLKATQTAIRRFGELMVWWPDIVALSRTMRISGMAISEDGV